MVIDKGLPDDRTPAIFIEWIMELLSAEHRFSPNDPSDDGVAAIKEKAVT